MISDVLAALQADTILAAILSGGMYAETEISRQNTPDAFDENLEIMPCALINQGSQAQAGPYVESDISARLYLRVYFYQHDGYDVIGQAVARVRTLLHKAKIGSGVWEIAWADDVPNMSDQALECSLAISTYQVTRLL